MIEHVPGSIIQLKNMKIAKIFLNNVTLGKFIIHQFSSVPMKDTTKQNLEDYVRKAKSLDQKEKRNHLFNTQY